MDELVREYIRIVMEAENAFLAEKLEEAKVLSCGIRVTRKTIWDLNNGRAEIQLSAVIDPKVPYGTIYEKHVTEDR